MCHHLLVLFRQFQEPGAVRLNLLMVFLIVVLDSLLNDGVQKLIFLPFHRVTPQSDRMVDTRKVMRKDGLIAFSRHRIGNKKYVPVNFIIIRKTPHNVPISTGKHSGVLTLVLTLYGNALTKT